MVPKENSLKKFYRSEFLQCSLIFVIYLLKEVYRKIMSEIYFVGKTRNEDLTETDFYWKSISIFDCYRLLSIDIDYRFIDYAWPTLILALLIFLIICTQYNVIVHTNTLVLNCLFYALR